ncbi:MAG: TRAP transporter small permease subunit [Pseudomonadota bacterium]
MSFARAYIKIIDSVNYRIGRIIMYGIFVMGAILLWSSISKTFFDPTLWTLEMAQFAMVTYYVLGGPYSIQLGSNVRMDLFYGEWSDRRKAQVDAITVFLLMFYLGVLLYGGLGSLAYSLGHYKGENFKFLFDLVIGAQEVGRLERSATAWRPEIWPIKLVMCVGVFLMLLQAVSELLKDLIKIKGGVVQ